VSSLKGTCALSLKVHITSQNVKRKTKVYLQIRLKFSTKHEKYEQPLNSHKFRENEPSLVISIQRLDTNTLDEIYMRLAPRLDLHLERRFFMNVPITCQGIDWMVLCFVRLSFPRKRLIMRRITYWVCRDIEAVDQTRDGDPDIIVAHSGAETYSPSYHPKIFD